MQHQSKKSPWTVIKRGRMAQRDLGYLEEDNIAELLTRRLQQASRSTHNELIPNHKFRTSDFYVAEFPNKAPDVALSFHMSGKNKKFPNRRVLDMGSETELIQQMKSSLIVIVHSMSGENPNARFTGFIDMTGLADDFGGKDCRKAAIIPHLYTMQNDKHFLHKYPDGKERLKHNARTPANMARYVFSNLEAGLYVPEPHSFSGMRIILKEMPDRAFFPSMAAATVEKLKEHHKATNIETGNSATMSPDGAMKHLKGSARMLAYLKAYLERNEPDKATTIPVPRKYNLPTDHPTLEEINQAYNETYAFFQENPEQPYNCEISGSESWEPHTNICRAWKIHCAKKGLPLDTPVPLLVEEFEQHPDFILMDKVRLNQWKTDKQEIISGIVQGKHLDIIDDLSFTGGTQKTAAITDMNLGAKSTTAVLAHGSFSNVKTHHKRRLEGFLNGLQRLLHAFNTTIEGQNQNLFTGVLASTSVPAFENNAHKLLRGEPENIKKRVHIYSIGEICAECAVDAVMRDKLGIPNPNWICWSSLKKPC